MPIDFNNLVLRPAQSVFGRMAIIDPIRSQPGKPKYAARGIFTSVGMDVPTMEGVILSDQRTTLSIRKSEFSVLPDTEDKVTIDGAQYWIADRHEDGQGGMTLILRKVNPEQFV